MIDVILHAKWLTGACQVPQLGAECEVRGKGRRKASTRPKQYSVASSICKVIMILRFLYLANILLQLNWKSVTVHRSTIVYQSRTHFRESYTFKVLFIVVIMEAYADPNGSTPNTEVDIEKYPTAKRLVNTCRAFFSEIDNL